MMYNPRNDEKLLSTLWDFTHKLYLEDRESPDDFTFMDKPNRVFQEASLMMVRYHRETLDKQLFYYNMMRSVTDEYNADPISVFISTPENSLESLGYEAAKALFLDMNRLKEHVESESICHLMDNLIDTDSDIKVQELLNRVNELKHKFIDPRIIKLYSEMLIVTKISTSTRLEEELLQQCEIIKKVPIQASDINVPLEKVRFVQFVNEYYLGLGEREKAKFYFADVMEHLTLSLTTQWDTL